MAIKARENRIDVLQGTLDMLILQILQWGPRHGLAIAQTHKEQFAPAQFHAMSKNEKVAKPAFVPEDGGVDITASGDQLRSSLAVRRVVRYEQVIIDTNFKRFVSRLILWQSAKNRFSTQLR